LWVPHLSLSFKTLIDILVNAGLCLRVRKRSPAEKRAEVQTAFRCEKKVGPLKTQILLNLLIASLYTAPPVIEPSLPNALYFTFT